MPINKEKKSEILAELKDKIQNSGIIIFVNFHGLATAAIDKLRILMRQAGAKYFVAKKTLIKKSLEDFKFSGEMPFLEGEVGLVFGGQEVSVSARILAKFMKEYPEAVLLGGVLEKDFVAKEIIARIASLPSREILLGQFLNVINAPMRQVVGVLRAPMRDLVNVLRQIKQ